MSNAVATVAFLQGQAWAKAPDGSLRPLSVGSVLNDDEVLVTANGAQVQLDFGSGEPVTINGGQEVAMSRDFNDDTATSEDEALLDGASVDEALTVLEEGGDLLEELEETAAGDNGGGSGSDGSSNFVRLTRTLESTDPQAFNYQVNGTGTAGNGENTGNDVGYINRAPQVTDQTLSGNEDEVINGQIIASDIEGDVITYTMATAPANGTLVLDAATGQFTFTPNANYNGSDSFVVTVTDIHGNASTTTINLNIAPVNDAPTTNDINLTTDEDTPVNGQVVAQDIEGDTLTYTVSGVPANGSVTLDPATGAFVYTPNTNFNGSDSFVVTISDGNGGTTTSLVNIGVTPVNDAPVSNDQNLVTDEDTPINGQVVATDVDGDTLGYSVSTQPANGAVTLNPATGGFVYAPNANYNGSDSFVVTISDGNGGTTTSLITIGINPVNDAPVSSDQNLTTPEDAALTGQIVATDVEGDTLAYAVSNQPTNGTVTLNPATGGFVYTPNANYNGSDSFVVTISDGNGGTTTSRINIGVTPVNDAPVSSNLSLTTPEETPVSGQVSASDIDGDSLSFSVGSSPANGSVTLNAATGSFVYSPNASFNGSDSFVVTISDGNGGTTTSVVSIGVTPVNDGPSTSNISLTTDENMPVNGAVTATDPDGDTLSFSVTGNPANGTVVLNPATGTFTYTPVTGYSGSDSFIVTVSDGNGGTTTSTVTIGVNAVNNAPTAANDTATTDESTAVTINVRSNDVDPDGDALTVTGVTQGANGSVMIVAGNAIYTPNAGFVGTDTFTYTIEDGNGGTDTATVTVTVNAVVPANNAPVAVADIINVAEGGVATTLDGGATSLLANDSDVERDPLVSVLVSGPAHGNLLLNPNGTFSYRHDGSENHTDSFTYKVNDGTVDGNTVTVNINVTPVNDAPVGVADKIKVAEGGTATVLDVTGATSVLANDSDAEGNIGLTANVFSMPLYGTLLLNPNGTFIYTHNGSETTTDSFTYTVRDGMASHNVTVNIEITPVNDAPVARDDTATVLEDGSVTIAVRTNDTDAEGGVLTVSIQSSGANGSVTIDPVSGNPVYTPNSGFSGTDSFTYTVSDASGAVSNIATVTVTVTGVNDAPVAVDDTFTVAEGGTLTVTTANKITLNDTDTEGDALSAILVTAPANGTLTLNADGTFTYTHNGSETTTDSFTYKVNDGTSDSNTVTVSINVTPVNDAPVAVADTFTVAEGGTLTVTPVNKITSNDTDADSSSLTAVLVTGPANGILTLNSDGTFTYVHNGSETTSDSFTYKANDGTSDSNVVTVHITVTPVNDAPETNDVTATGNEDTLITVNLSGTDSDGTVAGYVINTLPANGVLYSDIAKTIAISAGDLVTGPVYFMPAADWNGTTNFSYAARDNSGAEDATAATATVNVTPVADPALIGGSASGSVKEDTPAQTTATGTLTVADVDSGEASFNARTNSPGTYGHFSIDASGNWTYTIDNTNPAVQALKEGEIKQDSFSVTSVDGTSTTVTINVIGTNDGPVAAADTVSVNQDQVLTLTSATLLANDTDLDGDTLSISSVQGAVNGTVHLVGGNVEFTPTAGYHGPASFTYTVIDGKGGTSTATVSVTVDKANTAPDAVDDKTGSVGSSNVGLVSEYFGYNDTGGNPNLTNLTQIFSFISGRTPDATFVAKTFDYGAGVTFGNNLGTGTNLQSFLGSDATSLSTDPATSTDAIIRMRGFVEMEAGTYNFKIVGDDGYRIYIDGVIVADANYNQQMATTTHSSFTLTNGGLHHIEIMYWDQGTNARLKLDVSADGGTTYKSLSTFPMYQQAALSTVEDNTLTIPVSSLLGNDTDVDGDTLSILSVQGAQHGVVTLVGGNILFVPAANYSGPASFTYTISDGKGGTDTATANITVTPVNDAAPVAVNDSATTKMNTVVRIPITDLMANDTDSEGDPLIFMSVQNAVNGSVLIYDGKAVFTPTSNFEGAASFTYTIRDSAGETSTATVNIAVGSASTPSVVVSRSLLAVAHGTSGTSVKFPITTKLVDTDGSEILSIKVSNVPTGLSFNAGTNLGGGVWQFTEADLPNLTLSLPGSYTTNATHLTVQVTSTESSGGATASVSSVVTLKAAYTTVDITTESDPYTGSSASEYITGGNGSNTINGNNGNNIINGGGGDDNLSAGSGSDVINGGSDNDTINTGSGTDRIIGGSGNDSLIGGDAGENFVDVFVWSFGDQGAAGTPAVDTIQNFATAAAGSNTAGGDVLDLRDLLQGESVGPSNGAGNLANYLHFEVSGGNTIIHISHTGGFSADSHSVGGSYTSGAETQQIVLSGVNLLQSLYSGTTTDQQIITQLLNNNKLITD